MTRTDMSTAYDPTGVEDRWYATWLERGYFTATAGSGREPFAIVLPPPNITGALHMGHALDHTLQDVIARRKRMQGFEALWLPGTDHAGIATEVLVGRQLRDEGTSPQELGREAFIERVWRWRERYGGTIVEQMKRLGNSCDWSRLRFTMDDGLVRAVRTAFVRLYEDGLIYRGERIINWCPTDHTALSDSEVEHEEVPGELVTFRYPLSDGSGHVDVATTRVETMLGDTGVAVHPDDDRYRDLVGRTVRHPFTGEDLPVVADPAVDPGFGTGAVKVTPAHDPADFDIAERTGLPARNVLTADAAISEEAPREFRGLDRYEARRRVLEALRGRGLVVAEERPYHHPVGHCYRCGSEVEPWLSGKQWFVAVDRLKGPARDAAADGRIRFFPERWLSPYTTWLDDLRDWNISRQLWWGHRIPVWYCANGHQFASLEDPTACPECGTGDLEQDPDVLDTWFSSQLWPFSTLGWPDRTEDLDFFYPTSVLVTGYEILYLWVARMIMSGLYFMDQVPFHHVLIHGLVRDEQNRKMSKSLGNVIDPLDLIDRHGADALRFSLARMAGPDQQNIPFGERDVEAARHFANKIWNAARLVLNAAPDDPGTTLADLWAEQADVLAWYQDRVAEEAYLGSALPVRWILSRHEASRAEVDAALEAYRFADAAQAIYRFLWSELADWGLELAKPALYERTPEERSAVWTVLAWVLERTLRLLHPIMPFVTEEVWQRFGAGESIVVAPWPEPRPEHRDQDAERRLGFAMEVITELRRFRSDHHVPPGVALRAGISGSHADLAIAAELDEEIRRLARLDRLDVGDSAGETGGSARLMVGGAEVMIPLAGVLDREAECRRLRGRIEEVARTAERSDRKLANEGFLSKAPAEIVEGERHKLESLKEERAALEAQLAELDCP